ncbi:MAG TPA: HAD family hydrolase [Armatimonadota bacterium]
MIRALIFDFDGLILDTETTEYRAWQEIYAQFGCALPLDSWIAAIGLAWGTFDPHHQLEATLGRSLDRETLRKQRHARFLELVTAEPVLPGVLDYLHTAQRLGISLAVASSSPRHWVVGHLDRLGLTGHFHAILSADDIPLAKPHPDLYLAALAALGVHAEEAIALEDSPNGITAAKRAGLYCVAVPNSLLRALPLELADLRLNSLADLPLEALLAQAAAGANN